MNITYRKYIPEDKDLLFKLSKNLEEYVKSTDTLQRIKNNPGFSEINFQDTLDKVEKYQGKILFAQDGDKVVGYIVGVIWVQSEKNILEIGEHKLGDVIDLYIEENYRGKGIGSQLLEMMENYFKEKGCDNIWIEVFADNTGAHKLYLRKGYVNREIGMLKQI